MPLLGKKVFNLSVQNDQGDAPYLIPHTKERFQSKSEYEKRKDLYAQSIWTCRATGHTSLTHEEAFKSEKTVSDQLKTQFPKCFEKEVLSFAHHNTISLEMLMDKLWWKFHQQFIIGEKVKLKVKIADKLIPAKIVSVDTAIDAKTNCNSPSSDKENTSEEKEKSPKKWVPPKFLPYTYSIELENEAKIIHSVPADDLIREEKAPSKDLLRLFIRVSAIRAGTCATSPWVVNADLVKEHRLVSKFADFFLSPAKMAEAVKKSEENGKKRKLSNGLTTSASKKLKLDKEAEKTKKKTPKSKSKGDKDSEVPKKKKKSLDNKASNNKKKSLSSPSKKMNGLVKKKSMDKDAIVVSDSDSDDGITLAKLKGMDSVDSDSDVPLYQLADQTTPKKKQKKGKGSESSDEDVPLSKIGSGTPKKKSQKKSSPSKAQKNEKTPTKKNGDKPKKKKEGKLVGKKKDGMKQVTLYDLTKKGKLMTKSTTPKKSPSKSSTPRSPSKPPPTPAIVRRLLVSKRETLNDKLKYSNLLKKAIAILSPAQLKNVPEKLREEIERRKKLAEEKAKLQRMTPEEREEYLKEKRLKAKEVAKEKLLQKQRDLRKRYEDTDLTLTPLPVPRLVPTPDGFPNELFGDVAMVTEFINCYGGLLMPDSEYPIFTDALTKALVGGSSGFTYLSRVLVVLLQTLLQDDIAKGYSELRVRLSDIAVSPYTASELVRLCLEDEDSDDEDEDRDVPEEYAEQLRESEFYQLELSQKLCVLRGLCSRVLATYSAQDYMEEQQRKALALTKQKISEQKQMAAQKKSVKQANQEPTKKEDEKDSSESNGNNSETAANGSMSILSFYGKEAEDSGEEGGWGSIVKRRREMAAKAAAERERQERERAILREKEYHAEKEKKKQEKKTESISEAILLARMVLRQDPIGTDRHHNRYWVFTNTTPGLYVEKGWMGQEVYYSPKKTTTPSKQKNASSDEDSCSEEVSEMRTPTKSRPTIIQTGETPLKVVYKTKKHFIENTVPHPGQNLWFTYRSQKDLDGLLKALHPQGIRESMLKAEVKKRYDDIAKAILQAQRTNLELRTSDGDTEMLSAFQKELHDTELRLRNGGLGGVPNFDKWDSKLSNAQDISTLGECLLEMKEGITEKFLQGFMKPLAKVPEEEKQEDSEEEEEEDDKGDAVNEEDAEKVPEKEDKRERAMREWREAVEQCGTMSRLHVLLAMLDTCVKWEKSAENAKCKICRKKTDDDRLLLCDECNQAFHMYCLRPALSRLPTGDWFCPACKPRRHQVRALLDSDEEEMEEKEGACRECGGTDKLVICSKCPAAYHTQCHEPPLRHPPRGEWECSDCKNGVTTSSSSRRKKGKYSRKAAPRRNYRQDANASDEEEEEEEEEDEAYESEEEEQREEEQTVVVEQTTRSGRVSRSRQTVTVASGGSNSGQRQQRGTSKTPKSGSRSSRSRNSASQSASTPTSTLSSAPRTSRRGPSELSLCEEVLAKVMRNKSSWPFMEPVDKKQVPDYHLLIKKPMDFQTMQKKCTRLSYASPQEFIEDAALVFENAESYNKADSDVFACMREVEKVFRESLGKVLPDWPYYRTITDRTELPAAAAANNVGNSESGRRRSRNRQ